MLPTKGLFRDIECPFLGSSCGRPYCHFRHKKKLNESEPSDPEITENAVLTYKPTPKSELAKSKSHIPISYVPDLAYSSTKPRTIQKATYKPTPITMLSSANTSQTEDDSKALQEIKESIADTEYNPTKINFEEHSNELQLETESKTEHDTNKTDCANDKPSSSKVSESKSKSTDRRSSKHKSKHKEKSHRSDKSRDRDKDRHKSRSKSHRSDKDRHSSSSKHKKSKKEPKEKPAEPLNLDNLLEEDYEDEDPLSECYKIFNEYVPPEPSPTPAPTPSKKEEEYEPTSIKKRTAHSSASIPTYNPTKKPKLSTPGQVLANRFKAAKLAQANREQENIIAEIKTSVQKPSPILAAARQRKLIQPAPKPSTNIIDDIINGTKPVPKKIAPVQNLQNLVKAKAKIDELKTKNPIKTIAQTIKHSSRVAHVPEFNLSDIPDVLQADRSKLPVNVRTRFLTMIAEECSKLYLTKQDSYNRALNEEFACYEKCKVLVTYRNSAMLAVNRLRKELQEREKQGLGPIDGNETSSSSSSSDKNFYESIKQWILTEEELDVHGYPKESSKPGKATIKNRKAVIGENLDDNQRKCARCSKIYLVDNQGLPIRKEDCLYHPLRKRTIRGEQTYLCCKSNDDSGCASSDTHVCELSNDAELEGFQTTMKAEANDPRSYAVYALDCEMCYTTKGLELTRVTIVDKECRTVYESLVKPLNPIVDYNTRFSGITKDQLEKTSTSILQIQANILHLCNSDTILIGHSLESDMKALKIVHGTIIDTSVLFPHKMGLPHKRALRVLASEYLRKIIQNDVGGHDSAEDAITCMELIKWKLKDEKKLRKT